jgi:polyphosphate kinase 2 (PPK2 family)
VGPAASANAAPALQISARLARYDAPWFVVPADIKWFTRVVVAAAVIDALESLDQVEYINQ